MTDPSNRPFLEAIGRGECPQELAPANPNTQINVNIIRSARDYTPPEQPRHVAFSGQVRTLAGAEFSTVFSLFLWYESVSWAPICAV